GRPPFLRRTLRTKTRKRAALAEVARLRVFQRGGVSRRGKVGERLPDDAAQVFHGPLVGEAGFDLAGDLGERRLVLHRQVGEHLAVDLDVRLLEPGHERAVAHSQLAHRCVDARNPQRAHGTLLVAAVAVGVLPRLHHRLFGDAEDVAAAAAEALGLPDYFLVARARRDSTLDSWHGALLTSREASREWRACWSNPPLCCGGAGASSWCSSW